MFAVGYGIGPTGTNNIAEAIAFIVGADKVMEMAREHANLDAEGRNRKIYALLDSQIVVDMLNGKSMEPRILSFVFLRIIIKIYLISIGRN